MTAALLLALLAADPAGRIHGQVIDANTGLPIPKAAVDLYRPVVSNILAISARTDANGRFEFASPGLGPYRLIATKGSYLRKDHGPNVMLTKENPERQIRLVLEPAASISGHIADEDGEPLEGSELILWKKESANGGSWRDAKHITTNSRGDFAGDNLTPGIYLLSAQVSNGAHGVPAFPVREDGRELAFPPHYYPGVTEASQAIQLHLKSGGSLDGVHLVMRRYPVFRVEGRFVGNPGWKAADIDLMRSPESQDGYPFVQDLTHYRGTSPDEPNFSFFNVFPGSYRLRVFDRSKLESRIVGLLDFVVDSDHRIGLVVPPISFASLRIKLAIEGAPAQGSIKLDIRPTRRFHSLYTSDSTQLSAGEVRSLSSLVPGRYTIKPSFFDRSGYIKSIQTRRANNLDDEFDLPASGEEITIIYSTRMASLHGKVEGKLQTALHGDVLLLPEDPSNRSNYILIDVEADKSFLRDKLQPSSYLAIAFEELDRSRLSDPDYLKPFLSRATKITLGEDETKSVTLRQIPASESMSEQVEGPRP